MSIEIRDIHKSFKKKPVLESVCLQAQEGCCVGILGENGCGKSTLLNILAGVLPADSGDFFLGDQSLLKNRKLRSKMVGYVPQGTPLLQELTAWDNLRLWYESSGQNLKEDLKTGVPAMLGVDEFLRVPVCRMSGGMKKRLSISCAVAHRPRILLLDEPSAALDLVCKEKISNYLLDFKRQGGILLLATHDVQELPLCDRWYIMKSGRLHSYEYDGNIHTLVGKL